MKHDRLQPINTRTKTLAPHLLAIIVLAAFLGGCASEPPTLFSAVQADGWSAQPVAVNQRFTSQANLAPTSGVPVGDEGYYLHILTVANEWNYRDTQAFIYSFVKHPAGHTWLILESPQSRLECGHSGNYGLKQPRYHDGVIAKIRDNDPDPIAYIWTLLHDGQFELGNPGYEPTYVWRLPITKPGYERIQNYILNRDYTKFSLHTNNCGEMVTDVAALAGINLTSLIRITFPEQGVVHGHHLRAWTDPQFSVFTLRSIDLLEEDLRHLARLGIGSGVTAAYRASKPYQRLIKLDHPSDERTLLTRNVRER